MSMRLMKWILALTALALAACSSIVAAETRASLSQSFWQNEAKIEAYERQASGKDHINVFAGVLLAAAEPGWNGWGTGVIATEDMLMLPMERLPSLALDISLYSQRPVSEITRALLRMDRDYRRHLQNEVLPALREKSRRLALRMSELTPVPAGRGQSGSVGADPNEATMWTGGLDGDALARAHEQVGRRGDGTLQEYSAGTARVRLYPDGRIELMTVPDCTVETKTYTSNRRDEVTTTTRTSYRMNAPGKLSGEQFKVEVTVERKTRSKSNDVNQASKNTYSKGARLVTAENGREKLLYLYNGQDSVPVVPWRLYSEIVK